MLQDHVRTLAYRNAILSNAPAFVGSTVCDLGAGSGILSYFAAQAGAQQVFAIEASGMARRMQHLIQESGSGRNEWLQHCNIAVIEGKVEDISPIETVDILISEPIGVLLLHERMCESYIIARDRFLRPGGLMIPNAGSIHLVPFSDANLWSMTAEKVKFWLQKDFYGVDWSPLGAEAMDEVFSHPVVGNFDTRILMAESSCPHFVDFTSITLQELYQIDIPLFWSVSFTGIMHGVAGWFDLSLGQNHMLSTGPWNERTHWQQIRFLFKEPLAVNARERVKGRLEMRVNEHRSYDLRLVVWVVDETRPQDGPPFLIDGARRREGKFYLHEQTYWYDQTVCSPIPSTVAALSGMEEGFQDGSRTNFQGLSENRDAFVNKGKGTTNHQQQQFLFMQPSIRWYHQSWMLLLWAGVLGQVILQSVAAEHLPVISTTLRTPPNSWPAPSFVLETMEYLCQDDTTVIFPILSFMASSHSESFLSAGQKLSAKEDYESALRLFQSYSSSSSSSATDLSFDVAALKLALSLHVYAPKIQSFYDFYSESVVPALSKSLVSGFVDCPVWIQWNNAQYCDLQLFKTHFNASGDGNIMEFDHVYGSGDKWVVFLYAEHQSELLKDFHPYLLTLADSMNGKYVLRFKPSSMVVKSPLFLTGYGVELAIKSTEYKVVDDDGGSSRDASDSSDSKDSDHGIEAGESLLFEAVPIIKPLNVRQFQFLGYKAAHHIVQAPNSFAALVKVTQDFPKFSHLLATLDPDTAFRRVVNKNRDVLSLGLWLNGASLDMATLNAFDLVKLMHRERKLVQSILSLSFSASQASSLLDYVPSPNAGGSDLPWGLSFDTRSKSIVWLNNLQKDEAYLQWPKSLNQLLSPAPLGQMKAIRRNVFNCVFVLDLSSRFDLFFVRSMFELLYRTVPVRFGILPLVKPGNAVAAMMANCLKFIMAEKKLQGLTRFVTQLLQMQDEDLTVESLRSIFASVSQSSRRIENLEDSSAELYAKACADEAIRLGVQKTGGIFLNGKFIKLKDDWQQEFIGVYHVMLQYLLPRINSGRLRDRTNFMEYFATLPGVHPRRNLILFPEGEAVSDTRYRWEESTINDTQSLPWLSSGNISSVAALSVIVLCDASSDSGMGLIRAALQATASTHVSLRLLVIDSSISLSQSVPAFQNWWCALKERGLSLAGDGLKLMDEELALCQISNADLSAINNFILSMSKSIGDFSLTPENPMIIVNSKVLAGVHDFLADDFKVLFKLEESRATGLLGKVSSYIMDSSINSTYSHFLQVESFLGLLGSSKKRMRNPEVVSDRNAFWSGEKNQSILHFLAVLDPLSKDTQKIARILEVVSRFPNVFVKVFLLPNSLSDKKELPSRFYRFVLENEPKFLDSGDLDPPSAIFHSIPAEPLLTLGLDILEAWHVRPTVSKYDLDNIKLSTTKGEDVAAFFELQNILVQGHVQDSRTNYPPRGLQFVLDQVRRPLYCDTITMANYGYIQLKSLPGVWQLSLRSGRSSEIYEIGAIADSAASLIGKKANDSGLFHAAITVNDFAGRTVYISVFKKPGKEHVDLLDLSGDDGANRAEKKAGIWDNLKNFVQPSSKGPTINVFSVASGHLYERFLAIMMLSVRRTTKSPVKFWLIEDFLSPSFMEFIPELAREYGFDYEFVTYKWPHWLRAQSEKQRTIWGYKILFLDVLFPLSLDRVIFVDADQVVRTDLKQLMELDLKGCVYGYTPMCSSRKETRSFMFWRGGYWANHLQGRPYHISALYVIDLVKFRQVAAGDRLRQQYQMLSADPDSLANLDQDLPNNMQNELPIFSLPQDWLWCETWCTDESLKTAKTIDLCNNPLTKEPKLDRARRILPEWTGLDEEARAARRRFEEGRRDDVVKNSSQPLSTLASNVAPASEDL